MFKLINIKDSKKWNSQIIKSKEFSFLQSWEQGELEKSMGSKVERIMGIDQDLSELFAIQYSIKKAKRATIMKLRHAPILLNSYYELAESTKIQLWLFIKSEIKRIAKLNNVDFVRMQPLIREDESYYLKLISAPIHNIDAQKTLILDLNYSSEELLSKMRKQTRYNINKAKRLGISTTISKSAEDMKIFFEIHSDTIKRQNFKSYSLKYYLKFLENFNSLDDSNFNAKLYIIKASHEGIDIASAIIIIFGNKAFYSDGGSLTSYKNMPGSYAIQWKAIEIAKSYDCKSYNFWGGVSPDKSTNKYIWAGIDLFKRGFGGDRANFAHAVDMPLNLRYPLVYIWETYERIKRGY